MKKLILVVILLSSILIIIIFHPYLKRVDFCNPTMQSVWALPCYRESLLPKGSPTPNCDQLRRVQTICRGDTLYLVTPFFGDKYLQKAKK